MRLRTLDPGRVAAVRGLIFVPAGLVKFVLYHWELHAFQDFGIPAASVMEPLVGLLEIVGGLLLVRRVLVVPAALVLAVIMSVAFVTGGIIHGSLIPSDTLAPALLVAMIYLIGVGLTRRSTDSLG
ncbi:MAG TPA: DoxX family membrane protein [Solirubrobacteraceae bacterium]|nr:DoxX family membrane protein [Solirubrobacteraceae bacterium]